MFNRGKELRIEWGDAQRGDLGSLVDSTSCGETRLPTQDLYTPFGCRTIGTHSQQLVAKGVVIGDLCTGIGLLSTRSIPGKPETKLHAVLNDVADVPHELTGIYAAVEAIKR